jgi:hypothetical protein
VGFVPFLHFGEQRDERRRDRDFARSHGLFQLPTKQFDQFQRHDFFDDCVLYVVHAEFKYALDLVELVFRYLDRILRDDPHHRFGTGVTLKPDVSRPLSEVGALPKIFGQRREDAVQNTLARGKVDLTEAYIDGTHAGAKRGALMLGSLAAAKRPRSWQCGG